MLNKIAVAFQTCDRFHYTKTTVESFIKINGTNNFDLYYGDDASTDLQVHKFMKRAGVKTAVVNKKRMGCARTCSSMLNRVAEMSGADYLLYIQNDCKSERPIPVDLVHQVFNSSKDIGIFRLFGVWKDGEVRRRKAGRRHKGDRNRNGRVIWKPYAVGKSSEKLEISDLHWMFLPSIIRTELALRWLKKARSEKEMCLEQWKYNPGILSVRPAGKNFLSHMGPKEDRTPGFKS